ncbi:hypothetical protein FMUND_6677 [Fusarium mundagurra]|uniref:Uncharacterized protein n=1 Tax=Fusarium mundagurra TaxID=1567541 RepID=A0A8H5YN57_9HYPO|nr:hypothetical protein FMUND_6677 [Fusarium mundagurra]
MPRPKTDQEIQQGWGDLQWKFMNWFEASTHDICQCHMPGAAWNAFEQLVAKSFPDEKDQEAFNVWVDEWLGRHLTRMTYRMEPKEFITQVMATDFIDAQSTSDFLKSVYLNYMPWVPIGTSQFGGVQTFYAFKPSTNYLEPDRVEPSPDAVGNYILTMKLKSKTRAASDLTPTSTSSSVFNPSTRSISDGEAAFSRPRSSTASNILPRKEHPEKAPDKDEHLVFAQIGTLHVYGGACKDAAPENIPIINQGLWWSNGFAVVVELDKKGGNGAVYVVYNDCPLKDEEEEEEEFEEYAGPSEECMTDTEGVAANHEPGKLHPECNQKFKVAKIADSLKCLGDLQTRFVFDEISKDKRPIHSTRIMTDKVLGRFILHAKDPA